MKIGSHVSNNGKLMLEGSIIEALSYDANCFMVYLGAPQNTIRKPLSAMNIAKMQDLAKENNILLEDIIVHAPYIVNLARLDSEKHQFAVNFLTQEVRNVAAIGGKYLVLHPGSHTDCDTPAAIKQIAQGLNQILANTNDLDVVICLETMAGKGNEVGRTFEELKAIIDLIDDQNRIGVCLDTCHLFDAGYDLVNRYDDVKNEFNRIIGFNYLKVIHINDSKNILASHKDRHENIGFGNIGFNTIIRIINDQTFINLPKILETPYITSNDKKVSLPPYRAEIKMIKSGVFNPNLKEEVLVNK